MSIRYYAHTPDPTSPEPDEPHKVPVEPPAEPPNPNPVHVPPGGPRPGDLPGSNPDTIARRAKPEREHPVRLPHRDRHPVSA